MKKGLHETNLHTYGECKYVDGRETERHYIGSNLW